MPGYRVKQAASLLGAAPDTLRRWIKEGKLPEPPRVQKGTQTERVFDEEYIVNARVALGITPPEASRGADATDAAPPEGDQTT